MRSAFFHDLRNAEAAADLHQLAARDDHLAVLAEAVQHQQHGGGVVVDHQRGLGPAQATYKLFHQFVAAAAPAGAQVELQIAVAIGGHGHGLPRLFGQHGAAQIGMHHHARGVEHGPEPGPQSNADVRQQGGQLGLQVQLGGLTAAPGADVLPPGVPEPRGQFAQQSARSFFQIRIGGHQGVQTEIRGRDGAKKLVHGRAFGGTAASKWGKSAKNSASR